MPLYLDTRGNTKVAIAICARCGVKYPWVALSPDPNAPGLMVCPDGCKDQFDPYRLPARETENITLEWARPDVGLAPGPMAVPANQIEAVLSLDIGSGEQGASIMAGIAVNDGSVDQVAIAPPVAVINQPQPWGPNQQYSLGAQVTAAVEYGATVSGTNPAKVYLCIVPGQSGSSAPKWGTTNGTLTMDNQVEWLTNGVFLP